MLEKLIRDLFRIEVKSPAVKVKESRLAELKELTEKMNGD